MDTPLAITLGDANGVGPEVALRLFDAGELTDKCVFYGDLSVIEFGRRRLQIESEIKTVTAPSDAKSGIFNLIDLGTLEQNDITPGSEDGKVGAAALKYVRKATQDALAGEVAGLVTLPMNKAATQIEYPSFTGHTEYIADLCDTTNFAMMLATDEVAVGHVSTHVALAEAIESLNTERIQDVIALMHTALRRFVDHPRIAVCGLNPHAGEGGAFGTEERARVLPAIEASRDAGIDCEGPLPADTVFRQAIHQDKFDGIVCMYHDQGHAPMKLWAFDRAVNVTIGLPIVRTSVDHGTAYDIAWQGVAFTESLKHAYDYARKLTI